jgi:hypothetical protein
MAYEVEYSVSRKEMGETPLEIRPRDEIYFAECGIAEDLHSIFFGKYAEEWNRGRA